MKVKWTHKGEPHPWKEDGMPTIGAQVGSRRGGAAKGKSLGGTRDESFEAFSLPLNAGRERDVPGVHYGPKGEVLCSNKASARELAKVISDSSPTHETTYGE